MGTLLSDPDDAGDEVTDRFDTGDGDLEMERPSEDNFILLELPELTPPSESTSLSLQTESLSVSMNLLPLLFKEDCPLLWLRGLELDLHDRSVGSRGGDGDEVDTDILGRDVKEEREDKDW